MWAFLQSFRSVEPGSSFESTEREPCGSASDTLTCVACYEKIEQKSIDFHKLNALLCSSVEENAAAEETETSNNSEPSITRSIPSTHITCGKCIHQWIKAEISSNNLHPDCPEYACERKLSDSELLGILGDNDYDKLLSLRTARQIESNPLLRWCPNPKCGSVVKRLDTKTRKMDCLECEEKGLKKSSFCSDCTSPWTTGHSFTCKGEDISVKQWAVKHKTLSSRMFIAEKVSQRCPSCKTRIEKDGGCNHIICWR